MLTKEQCQKKIFQVAIKLGVSPRLITTRLLSTDDKHDMMNGLLDDESLEMHVSAWMASGMPDYTNGTCELYKAKSDLPMKRYRGTGKSLA